MKAKDVVPCIIILLVAVVAVFCMVGLLTSKGYAGTTKGGNVWAFTTATGAHLYIAKADIAVVKVYEDGMTLRMYNKAGTEILVPSPESKEATQRIVDEFMDAKNH